MKLAILACLAALCLSGPSADAAPGDPAKDPAKAAIPAKAPPPPAAAEQPAPAAQAARPAPSARAERRRRSYAACNRASHQRGLRGGKRRRFLIRCRLGYERTRGQQIQAPAPAAVPVQPVRKP